MYKYLLNSVMLCIDMLHSVDSQTFVQMIEHGSEQTPNYAHKYENEEINGSPQSTCSICFIFICTLCIEQKDINLESIFC